MEYFIGSLSMCSASVAVALVTSFTPEQTCGRAIAQHREQPITEKSGCVINLFACSIQSSCVNRENGVFPQQLQVQRSYLHGLCNPRANTKYLLIIHFFPHETLIWSIIDLCGCASFSSCCHKRIYSRLYVLRTRDNSCWS